MHHGGFKTISLSEGDRPRRAAPRREAPPRCQLSILGSISRRHLGLRMSKK
jgi:hypothetical protein